MNHRIERKQKIIRRLMQQELTILNEQTRSGVDFYQPQEVDGAIHNLHRLNKRITSMLRHDVRRDLT